MYYLYCSTNNIHTYTNPTRKFCASVFATKNIHIKRTLTLKTHPLGLLENIHLLLPMIRTIFCRKMVLSCFKPESRTVSLYKTLYAHLYRMRAKIPTSNIICWATWWDERQLIHSSIKPNQITIYLTTISHFLLSSVSLFYSLVPVWFYSFYYLVCTLYTFSCCCCFCWWWCWCFSRRTPKKVKMLFSVLLVLFASTKKKPIISRIHVICCCL